MKGYPSLGCALRWVIYLRQELSCEKRQQELTRSIPVPNAKGMPHRIITGTGGSAVRRLRTVSAGPRKWGKTTLSRIPKLIPDRLSGVRSTMRGRRTVSGAMAQVQAVLCMEALAACRHKQVIRNFCQRPLAAGKAQETGVHPLHSKAAHHTQRHGQERPALVSTRNQVLTSKTVASNFRKGRWGCWIIGREFSGM